MRWILVALVASVAIFALVVRRLFTRFFYPVAQGLPPVVSRPIDELISELEALLRAKAPLVLDTFNPGLSDERIRELERLGRFHLPDDLKALYRWHNGCQDYEYPEQPGPMRISVGPMPGHRFLPLDEAIAQRKGMWSELTRATFLQRTLYWLVCGHRRRWLTIFGDMCGDGYFFDPGRDPDSGNLFYSFPENSDLAFFPSARNLFAWMVRCYEEGAFRWSNRFGVPDLNDDVELSWQIRDEFASRAGDARALGEGILPGARGGLSTPGGPIAGRFGERDRQTRGALKDSLDSDGPRGEAESCH